MKVVLSAFDWYHKRPYFTRDTSVFVDDYLIETTKEPRKVVEAEMAKAHRKGFVAYGVSLRSGWLTDKGRKEIES